MQPIQDLEKMILDPSERYRIQELMVRMLRLLTRNRFIKYVYLLFLIRAQNINQVSPILNSNDTWQMYFAREIDKRGELEENPFYEQVEQQLDDKNDTIKDEDVTMKDAVKEDSKQQDVKQDGDQQDDDKKDDPVEEDSKQENGIKEEEDTKQASDQEQEQKESIKERRPINYFDMPLELRVHLLNTLCEVSITLLFMNLLIHGMYISYSGNWMMLSASGNILTAKKMLCIG